MRELDQVAEGLDRSVRRVADLLAAEREFAMDASHQLRTPLTALSMRLEEMIAAADDPEVVREEGAAALAQTERLANVVSQLLGRTTPKESSMAELASIDDIVAQQVAEWEPAFRRADRKLEVIGTKGLHALATAGEPCPGDRDAGGQRARARRGHGGDPDVADAEVGGRGDQGRGPWRAGRACAADLRAQRERPPGRNRARARARAGYGGRRRRQCRPRPAAARGVRDLPAAPEARGRRRCAAPAVSGPA